MPRTLTDEEKQARSWQYYGYPAFATWMASSNDCFMLRRYSRESARCLLLLQHRIAKKSKELDEIDEFSRAQPIGRGSCDSFDDDEFPGRIQLIEELGVLLQRYYDLANAFGQVRKNQTARAHHIRNLDTWFGNYPEAIDAREQHFREEDKQGDLFPIVLKERSPLRLLIGQSRWLRRIFKPRASTIQADSDDTWYTSETALDRLTNTFILLAGLLLLFGPMWALHFVGNDTNRLAIITGFVSAFTGLTFSAAGQRPFEILAATAAYAAVLSVYLQEQ